MADVGLNNVKGKQFRSLSGGEAQRLMFARALAGAPDLILVDEPTAQLDPANSAAVISAMKALAGRGSIVVVATHDPNVAQACTRQIGLSAQ
jgi:ABC-type lipoprotein export system ATPase subunit